MPPTTNKSNHLFKQNFASLDLLIGPMFAGKTTELLRQLTILSEMGLNCCYVNSKQDSRSSGPFSTHNNLLNQAHFSDNSKKPISSIKITNIEELLCHVDQYDVFGIDEAQLFSGLLSVCNQLVDDNNKKVIVAGLNGTSEREPFGEIVNLIPFSDKIQKLEPFCKLCAEQKLFTPAIFTKCMIDKTNTIMIGGKDIYTAVCRQCYINTVENIDSEACSPQDNNIDSPPTPQYTQLNCIGNIYGTTSDVDPDETTSNDSRPLSSSSFDLSEPHSARRPLLSAPKSIVTGLTSPPELSPSLSDSDSSD